MLEKRSDLLMTGGKSDKQMCRDTLRRVAVKSKGRRSREGSEVRGQQSGVELEGEGDVTMLFTEAETTLSVFIAWSRLACPRS